MKWRTRILAPCAISSLLVLTCSRGPAAGIERAATSPPTQESVPPTLAAAEPDPAATIDPSIQKAWESLGTLDPPTPASSPDTAPLTANSMPSTAPPATPPAVPLGQPELQQESEVDMKRRVGTEEFGQAMAALSRKADQADVAWNRFLEGCRANVTNMTAVAGVADREWIAFAGVSKTTSQWTEACAEAGTFFALVRQVRDGMCVAEDRARRMWVRPGSRRDLRHRFRLNWEGWDAACQ